MKIGIIGCGITGLSAALKLSSEGYDVEVIESAEHAGGIASSFEHDGVYLEKYYHHFFKSDEYTMKLLEILNLKSSIKYLPSRMGYFSDGKSYDFGTPISLLKFKPLGIYDKFRFGTATLKILLKSDWKSLENISARDWIIENAGRNTYEKVWKPLLVTKFADRYKEVSMAWLWGKMNLRGTSKENGKEVLGYIDGSLQVMIDELLKRLIDNRVLIQYGCRVNKIEKDTTFKLETSKGIKRFDKVISTVQLPAFLNMAEGLFDKEYVEPLSKIEYTSVVCTILMLEKSFMPYYWLNIGDDEIPFGGLIEHTNLLGTETYGGQHILYISNYLFKDSKYYSMDEREILNAYMPYLRRVNSEFNESWVKGILNFKDEYAQPVIKMNYSQIMPKMSTPVEGLYMANMCNIYPEDRGVNYAIKKGFECAEMLMGK